MSGSGRSPGPQSGAIVAVVLIMAATLAAAGAAFVDAVALTAGDELAGAAADAVAHASEIVLSQDDYLAELSVKAQANQQACLVDSAEHQDAAAEDDCAPTLAAARAAAAANGAELTYFRFGPGLPDRLNRPGAGRLITLVRVAVRRRLPIAAPRCSSPPPAQPSLCWAAAQLT
ncbi:MAG: hypothetical protein NVSMB29_06640 [Candidatus Dormibacteria bacterium]